MKIEIWEQIRTNVRKTTNKIMLAIFKSFEGQSGT